MKTVLVICESGYWHDLREGLAAVEIGFLGFDKKKPRRSEIDQLVAQADFVMIRTSMSLMLQFDLQKKQQKRVIHLSG